MMKTIREKIIKAAYHSKEGHIPSALSILDILWVLYDKVMKYDAANPDDIDRDRFVLSKGHASLGLYAILETKGLIPDGSIDKFCSFGSILGGHPDRNKIQWVEASTGSLGHGLPIAVGMAFGFKIRKSTARVFSIVGDGECNEGTIWESALLAAHHKLDNLVCIVDYNHSTDRALSVGDVAAKFKSFDWEAVVVNGHDQDALLEHLKSASNSGKPLAIVAETIKGYGIKSIENDWAWHHRSPKNEEELNLLIQEIY